jgi:hypothetical protein
MAVRVRGPAWVATWVGSLLALTSAAGASAPRAGPRIAAETLTALPAAKIDKPLRIQPQLRYSQTTPSFGWSRFVTQRGNRWHASWDAATGVPNRIWGAGIPAPGTVANAAVAEQVARQLLADHIALLAPGATIDDFVLASNHSDGKIRSVGFFQRSSGRRVIGGQVSFRFKRDRMIAIGSEALPHVTFAAPKAKLAPARMRDLAADTLRSTLALPGAPVEPLGDEVIVPLVGDDAVLGYRLARATTIDGGYDGRYLAYVDVATGAPLAVRQLNTYATGTVLYNVVDRYPLAGRSRIARPAPRALVQVNGAAVTTTMTGVVNWSPESPASVLTSVTGDLVTIVNKAGMASATATHGLAPGDSLIWDAEANVEEDAQINTFIAAGIAKEYVRNNIDPAMATLDEQMIANVNINQSCNAFFDGKTINFFKALPASMNSSGCQNTGLLHDVVFHEYGHRVHTAEIIPGVGDFDGAMSEGASDFLASSITGDHGMGRGFFYTDAALRELDPEGKEWLWPLDVGEIHHTGQIFGGIFWDLRKQLITDLGEAPGIAVVNKLFLGAMRRGVSIPSTLVEALVEDDDDGNLDNGTPHECAIRAAFGKHGLRTASGTIIAPGTLEAPALAIGVHIEVTGLTDRCSGDEVMGATLRWQSYTGNPPSGSMQATEAGPNKYFAQLPLARQDSVFYQARIHFADGSTMTLPDNWADEFYQLYGGPTVKLYCTDFESTDPFSDGWVAGVDNNPEHPWEWGTPTAGASDPHAAFSGSKILAMKLDGNYSPKQRAFIKTPVVDIGQYSDVRLHYRRWLAVEDHHFDQALITANGKKAWNNHDSDKGDSSAKHHIDREWRFQDVALSGYFSGHSVQVGWEIVSDEGLELGGWHLDDVCIVANPYAICGDGVKTATEQCDTGVDNQDKPDVCRTDCRLPTCGDLILDSKEQCDEGPDGTDTCSMKCEIIDIGDTGCCSSSGGTGSLVLGGVAGMLLLRRRRRLF